MIVPCLHIVSFILVSKAANKANISSLNLSKAENSMVGGKDRALLMKTTEFCIVLNQTQFSTLAWLLPTFWKRSLTYAMHVGDQCRIYGGE